MTKEKEITELEFKIAELKEEVKTEENERIKKQVDILKDYTSEIFVFDGFDFIESGTFTNNEILEGGYIPAIEVISIIESFNGKIQ